MAEEVSEEKKAGGGKGLIIILLVVVILLIAGIGVMAYFLLSSNSHSNGAEGADTAIHASAEHGDGNGDASHEQGHEKIYSPKYKQYDPPAPDAPPGYFVMDKFVVNFNGDGQAKYLAVDLQFMTYYPQVIADMEHLRPILKNDIQRLLRNQHYNDLIKAEGPDKLREELLQVARNVLEKNNIYPDLVEDVYMTRFVMQ